MQSYTAFSAGKIVGAGSRTELVRLLLDRQPREREAVLVFEDGTGRVTDLDYRNAVASDAPRTVGRPRLGVQSREVTLLPRHWDWLSQQSGGASAAIRRLVEVALSQGPSERERQDAAYRFMQAACGDLPGYEEALRALYRSDAARFSDIISGWPEDVQRYIEKLLQPPCP
jgi:hypothetical protein